MHTLMESPIPFSHQSQNSTIERSIYFVKPEALQHTEVIRQHVEAHCLTIVGTATVSMTLEILQALYPALKDAGSPNEHPLTKATIAHLLNKDCEVVVVKGLNAIEVLLDLMGRETAPGQCAPRSIRRRYGNPRGENIGC